MSTYRKQIMRPVDTLSTIYRHIFHSKLPTKSSFVEKKRSKVCPILSRKFQITYEIIICGEKMVKIGTILSSKSLKDPSWLAMWNVYFRNEFPTRLPVHLMPFSIRVTSCWYELAVNFYMSFVYWHCHEQSTCRIIPWIFWQSILSTIDNSTSKNWSMLLKI